MNAMGRGKSVSENVPFNGKSSYRRNIVEVEVGFFDTLAVISLRVREAK